MKGSKLKPSSRRELQPSSSYYGKHVQRSRVGKGEMQKSTVVYGGKWNQAEIAHRREQIIHAMRKNRDTSIIRIEDSPTDLAFSKNISSEEQSIWLEKIEQTRQKLDSVRVQITDQQRIAKQCQRELSEKQMRYLALMEKQEHFSRRFQEQTVQEEAVRSQYSQPPQEIRSKDKQNEQELNNLKQDQKILTHEVKQMEAELNYLRKQYKRLQSTEETEETVEDVSDLLQENERIKQSIARLETDNLGLQIQISNLESNPTPTEELYRRYTDLYEKIFIGRELQKVQRLMQAKEQMFKRQEEFERNKIILKERKKVLAELQHKVKDKEKQSSKILSEIMQLTHQMLIS